MQTDTIDAWQVEEGDYITLGGEAAFRVAQKDDTGESIRLVLKDDDEWSEDEFVFLPDDQLTIITRWDDPDEEDEEDND